jgi:hypothetical protein
LRLPEPTPEGCRPRTWSKREGRTRRVPLPMAPEGDDSGLARRSPGCTPWAGAGERWPGPREVVASPRPGACMAWRGRGPYLSLHSRPQWRGARPPPPSGGSWRRVPGCLPPVALPRSVLAPGNLDPLRSAGPITVRPKVPANGHFLVGKAHNQAVFEQPANCGFLSKNGLTKPFSGGTATRTGERMFAPPLFPMLIRARAGTRTGTRLRAGAIGSGGDGYGYGYPPRVPPAWIPANCGETATESRLTA